MTRRHLLNISVALFAGLAGCSQSAPDEAPTARELPVEVLTARVQESYTEARTYAGTVEARQTSRLAFQRVGRLTELLADEGQAVKQGEPLARLDTRELQQQQKQLEASLAQAKAMLAELKAGPREETIAATRSALVDFDSQLVLAVATYKRIKLLRNRGGGTDQQLDDAKSAVDSVKARRDTTAQQLDELIAGTRVEQLNAQAAVVKQFDAQLAGLTVRIQDSEIKAPFDGIIARRLIDTGSTVAPGQEVFTVIESDHLEARIGLPASVVRSFDKDASYSFLWRGTSVSGQFKAALPQVEQATRNQTVVFNLDSTGDFTPVPGDMIRVQHNETIPSRGFWLPLDSLTRGTKGLWSAFVVTTESKAQANAPSESPPNTIRRVTLEVVHTDGERVFVRGTLNDGDLVVASGSHRIVSGQTVDPIMGEPR